MSLSPHAVPMTEVQHAATVTVILPVYNGRELIGRALRSALEQTLPVTQILVVDDGSTDGTPEFVKAEFGDRVTVIPQQNAGPSKARNAGLKAATGEFVAFLDADDRWAPEKIEKQVQMLRLRPDAVGNYTGLSLLNIQGDHLKDQLPVNPTTLWPSLRWCNPGVPPSSMLIRRAALEQVGGFLEHLWGTEDWNLWVRLIALGPFSACSEPLTYYYASSTGMSSDADKLYNDFLKMLDDSLLTGFSGVKRQMWRRRIISYQAFKACLTARGAGEPKKERAYMMKSMLAWPSPFWSPERFKYFAVTLMRT